MVYGVAACSRIQPQPDPSAPVLTLIRNSTGMGDTTGSWFITNPEISDFTICHGNTCRYISRTSLNDTEWNPVSGLFSTPANTPAGERERVRKAVALLEAVVGEKTGTSNDKAENFKGMGESGQMDCVDESTNTSVYLILLQNAGLLHWHTVDRRASRGLLSLQPPHFTAVLREKQSSERYAVDSWFLDNGEPPYIVPLSVWKGGWKPGFGAESVIGK